MALGDYEKTTYKNGEAPGLSAQNLNKNEDKTEELDAALATHLADYAHHYYADGGSTDAYAITPDPAITAYVAGQTFNVLCPTANTGACTLNVCELGAKDIKKNVSEDLETGDILANQVVTVIYDGTNFQLLSNVKQFGAWEKITEVTLASDVAQVDFEDLGLEDYRIIKLLFTSGANGATTRDILLRFNDDTNTIYATLLTKTTTAAAGVSKIANVGYINIPEGLPLNTGVSALGELRIFNVASEKRVFLNYLWQETITNTTCYNGGGFWRNSSNITKISLIASADKFVSGSEFTLLGVK